MTDRLAEAFALGVVDMNWDQRALPILEAVYRAEERGERPDPEPIATETGLDPDMTGRTVAALVEADFLDGIESSAFGEVFSHYYALTLRERGRRAIGQWPPGPAEALIAALDQQIAAATNPDERSKLTRFREAAAAFLRDVGTQAAGTILGNAAGGFTPL